MQRHKRISYYNHVCMCWDDDDDDDDGGDQPRGPVHLYAKVDARESRWERDVARRAM